MRVAVIMGGVSPEHEVSLNSGAETCRFLDPKQHQIKPVIITLEGWWKIPAGYFQETPKSQKANDMIMSLDPETPALPLGAALSRLREEEIDVALLMVHGKFGEDGTIQGCLKTAGIPFTGSDTLGSALAMDKVKSKEIFKAYNILIPNYLVISEKGWKKDPGSFASSVTEKIGWPAVTKPSSQGSSVGVTICESSSQFEEAMNLAFTHGDEVIVEEYVQGRELACGVIESPEEGIVPLPPTEIIPKDSTFFNYEAKYKPGASEEITPASIDEDLTKKVQEIAVEAHRVLRCGGYSRTDLLLKGRDVYTLETNTLPGMTATSIFPEQAKVSGLTFSQMLDRIIHHAIDRAKRESYGL